MEKFASVDEYMNSLPEKAMIILEKVREIIRNTAPEAEEVISYQLPALKYHGMLIYYSAYKEHYSLSFPSDTPMKVFGKELEPYEVGKSSIKFPFDKPIPTKLIKDIVKNRMAENIQRKQTKKK